MQFYVSQYHFQDTFSARQSFANPTLKFTCQEHFLRFVYLFEDCQVSCRDAVTILS